MYIAHALRSTYNVQHQSIIQSKYGSQVLFISFLQVYLFPSLLSADIRKMVIQYEKSMLKSRAYASIGEKR